MGGNDNEGNITQEITIEGDTVVIKFINSLMKQMVALRLMDSTCGRCIHYN